MKAQRLPTLTGVALALAAAGLIGCDSEKPASTAADEAATIATEESATVEAEESATAAAKTIDLIHCYGVNTCKGHNDCGTADNDCAGKASCGGHGFVNMPASACEHVDGTQKDAKTTVFAAVDLIHCFGVNKCKGHNDCGTDSNSCAGHAECKGQGFVAMPDKACSDVGGKTG